MNTKSKLTILAATACTALFFASCSGEAKHETTTEATKHEMTEVETEISETDAIEYTCPMHPEVLQAESGTCPTCKMDLVEKKSEAAPMEEEHAH